MATTPLRPQRWDSELAAVSTSVAILRATSLGARESPRGRAPGAAESKRAWTRPGRDAAPSDERWAPRSAPPAPATTAPAGWRAPAASIERQRPAAPLLLWLSAGLASGCQAGPCSAG